MSEKVIKTVEQVIADYNADKENEFSAGRRIVRHLINSGDSMKVDNDSYADALLLTSGMMSHAKRSFDVFVGEGVVGFLDTLKDDVERMLNRFKESFGKARFIVLCKKAIPYLDALKQEYGIAFDYKTASLKQGYEKITEHFIVADNHMCRVEKPHAPITCSSPADVIKAEVSFNNTEIAQFYTERFELYWKYLEDKQKSAKK